MKMQAEYPARIDENGNLMRVRKAYDNGGKTLDRYTFTFEIYNSETGKWDVFTEGSNKSASKGDPSYQRIYCLSMSARPFSAQGVGQSGTCMEGKHLGKRVKFSELPEEVQRCVLQYMKS
ncbi:hypothetical protein STSP2_03262 [Anaerohalosphaera lusitana]|uniref:Uncharacterized protein n=1 Tax=Anaerohalosphaera lusitana TaxID=1936003 RepID=A0A1U9NR14_9BACT|nr:hypothetical protein [Anaerohalosphaera lusitana]AQT70060.1 hypothetical protein STSP2_03262 [Anaerohalosphaera lusitana]